jgi:uncharacterized protein
MAMKKRRLLTALLSVLILVTGSPALGPMRLLASPAGGGEDVQLDLVKPFWAIGTGGITGTYYPLGTALARLINAHFDGIVAISEPTGGSVANIEYLRQEDVSLALVQSDVAFDAFNGLRGFTGRPFSDARVLVSLYSEVVQVAVKGDSALATLSDLKAHRIVVGERGSGTAINALAVLQSMGWSDDEFMTVYMNQTKAMAALAAGDVDAVFFTGGVPNEALREFARRTPMRLLAFPGKIRERLLATSPYWREEKIPAATYPEQREDVPTVGLRALLLTRSDFDPLLAEKLLEVIFTRQEYLNRLAGLPGTIRIEDGLKGVEARMLHPGARSFFAARGLVLEEPSK